MAFYHYGGVSGGVAGSPFVAKGVDVYRKGWVRFTSVPGAT